MEERIPRMQGRQFLDHADFLGVEYSSLYMCKSKRGMKREEGKDAYKLPHRLIEKKRRDRINECIGQLKDLLPEHLKLTTLGHLEKAVVLELTLKHLNALTAVTEQQHQKIIALQNGERSLKTSLQADLDAFHSGFQACAKEVLQYLNKVENWTAREQRCTRLISHLHKVSAQFQPGACLLPGDDAQERDAQRDAQANCVPVIQRTQNLELNENDTDTDSGYGGEAEKGDGKCEKGCDVAKGVKIKQEFGDERVTKKPKMNWSSNGAPCADSAGTRPDVAFVNSLMGMAGVGGQQTPFCMPFYFINPSAAASYMPLFDKSHLEKLVYPAAALTTPFPWLYPGIPAHASAAAAAAIAFPRVATDKSSEFDAGPSKDSESPSPDGDLSNEAELASPVTGEHGSDNDAGHQPQSNENDGT
ncbi:class E basic helix-loop-helix protein 41 [Triplophysa rosa]|uniref:Class E basic helix-loop-helix protein 41 n=1 Tax=Triplophysa rosa TaxID=992332 RepID=A0A9W7WI36_TRIRA|nr:class E basic helix-loop-helix protein 41 [Triplophysa rosa]KAI7802562.1 class E basic helix-loop-helix protein 41 [Triplophysa rosa]